MFSQQIVFSSKTPFVARNLLEKLSRQVQVMERLAAVSDESVGGVGSVVEGESSGPAPTRPHCARPRCACWAARPGAETNPQGRGVGGRPHSCVVLLAPTRHPLPLSESNRTHPWSCGGLHVRWTDTSEQAEPESPLAAPRAASAPAVPLGDT